MSKQTMMKYIFTVSILLTLLFQTGRAQQGWYLKYPMPIYRPMAISFVDANHGWVASNAGYISKTEDGGESWNAATWLPYHINDIIFFDESTGWAVGDAGFAAKTTDGGFTWINFNIPSTDYNLKDLSAPDPSTLFAVANDGRFWYSTNGGVTWDYKILSGPVGAADLNQSSFINQTTGWVAGDHETLLKTTDGGLSWTSEFVDSFQFDFFSVSFTDELNGWVAGSFLNQFTIDGFLYHTIDGGDSWYRIDSPVIGHTVNFYNTNIGFVAAYNYPAMVVSVTLDGGATWTTTDSLIAGGYFIDRILYYNPYSQIAFAGSLYGLHKTPDFGLTWQEVYRPDPLVFWAHHFYFSSPDSGWLAIYNGYLKTTDGGETWERGFIDSSGSSKDIIELHFKDMLQGIAIASVADSPFNGYHHTCVYKTLDGGDTWDLASSLSNVEPRDMEVTPNGKVWLVANWGDEWGRLYYSEDYGNSWTLSLDGDDNTFRTISFLDDSIGWMGGGESFSGYEGILFNTNDGGTTWTEVLESFPQFNDIYVLNEKYAWIPCYYPFGFPSIYDTKDGGVLWEQGNAAPYPLPDYSNQFDQLTAICFRDSLNGWVVGNKTFSGSHDGGATWQSEVFHISSTPTDIYLKDDSTYLISYSTGVIISTQKEAPVPVSVDNQNNPEDLIVFPNPTSDILYVPVKNFKNGAVITITNVMGQVIFSRQFSQTSATNSKLAISTRDFNDGYYILELTCMNKKIKSSFIVAH